MLQAERVENVSQEQVANGEEEAPADPAVPPVPQANSSDENSESEEEEPQTAGENPGPQLSQQQGAAAMMQMQAMRRTMQPHMQLPAMQPMDLNQAWNRFHNPNNTNAAMAMRDHYLVNRPEYNPGGGRGTIDAAAPRVSYHPPPPLAPVAAPTGRGRTASSVPQAGHSRSANRNSGGSNASSNNTNGSRSRSLPPLPAASNRTSNNTNGRALQFRIPELVSLANIMEEVQPIGNSSWQRVESEYNRLNPGRPRNIDSLRRKFNSMVGSKVPTGNPSMPDHIRSAKRAHYKIVDKSQITTNMSSDEEGQEEEQPHLDDDAVGEEQQEDEANKGSSQKKHKAKKSPAAYANRKKAKGSGNTKNEVMEIFMAQRVEAQERRDLLEQQRIGSQQMMMQMFSTAITAFATAFGGTPNPSQPTPGVPVSASRQPAARAPERPWSRNKNTRRPSTSQVATAAVTATRH